MMEDELVRKYVSIIYKIVVGIKGCGGKKEDDEIIWNILKTLTPPFKHVAMMIEKVIPYAEFFSKEISLGRLEPVEVSLR